MPAAIAVDGAPVALARTKDLSLAGASLECARAIPAGTEVTIRLLGEYPFALTGSVIRSSGDAGGCGTGSESAFSLSRSRTSSASC